MYVMSNEVRAESGEVLGIFSRHIAAVAAMYRITNPTYKPNFPEDMADLAIEAEMNQRANEILQMGLPV